MSRRRDIAALLSRSFLSLSPPLPSIPSDTIHACVLEGIYLTNRLKKNISYQVEKSYFEIEAFSLEREGGWGGENVLNKFVSMKIHFFFHPPHFSYLFRSSSLSLSLLLLKCNDTIPSPSPFPLSE